MNKQGTPVVQGFLDRLVTTSELVTITETPAHSIKEYIRNGLLIPKVSGKQGRKNYYDYNNIVQVKVLKALSKAKIARDWIKNIQNLPAHVVVDIKKIRKDVDMDLKTKWWME